MALLLEKAGVTRVRPLEGGLAGWIAGGHPVVAGAAAPGTALPRAV
jgi:rhodanese-related sulfurtransferase